MPFYSPTALRELKPPIALLNTAQARALEAQSQSQQPPHTLMSRAGEALARLSIAKYPHVSRIAVLCGPGNNGGDGFVAACWLKARGCEARVYAATTSQHADDALWARELWLQQGQTIHPLDANTLAPSLQDVELVIDALFGAGLNRPLSAPWPEVISAINACALPVIAADIPSGLNSDTGVVMGAAVHADATLALLSLRPGHFTGEAAAHCGELWWHDLDIPSTEYGESLTILLAKNVFLPTVSATSHKGSRGTVGIIGGSAGMRGAPLLTARSALHLGAGRVHVGFIAQAHEATPEIDAAEPSLMCHAVTRQVWPFESDTWVFGPGAGMHDDAHQVLKVLLAHTHDKPLVLDADGLNLLATHPELVDALRERTQPAVLTPHPLEAARLLNLSTEAVQMDRTSAARALASRYASVVVLKGAGSVIAHPDGRVAINPTGGAWLATAGSGDVLTGVIAALLAQGLDAWNAACSAVYLHGCQQDMFASKTILPLVASQQPAAIAAAMQALAIKRRDFSLRSK